MLPSEIYELLDFIHKNNGIGSKNELINKVKEKFSLTKDRSIYYSEEYAIRFSQSKTTSFSNTVASLSALQKYDHNPFFVCLVTPKENILFLANTTFLKKISHSSHTLRIDNIKGSFNGSDISRVFLDIENKPENCNDLFNIHVGIDFETNLARLVESTNNIIPSGKKADITSAKKKTLMKAPLRATEFCGSNEYTLLKEDLDKRVNKFQNEIIVAGYIENIKVRGQIIEYLIAGEDERLKQELVKNLKDKSKTLPGLISKNELGDYVTTTNKYNVATDIKTKIMVLDSNPKAYNIDKMLEFLSTDGSIFMFYFVGIDETTVVNKALVPVFQKDLLNGTVTLAHWAGRNSRGVTQFMGKVLHEIILNPNTLIDENASVEYLQKLCKL